jgi:HAD superfamily hydrolase (TIGR01450 family)
MKLFDLKLFLFDLDGVLTVGKETPRYIGGRRILSKLKRLGKKILVLTNTSTHTQHEVWTKLKKLGFPIEETELLTSTHLLADYLADRYGRIECYVIGERGLVRELKARGHHVTKSTKTVDFVVVGLDRQLTYDKLNAAVNLLRRNAHLAAAYMDRVYMSSKGPAFSAGPIAKALEYASGKSALVVGKPSPIMFRTALKQTNTKSHEGIMIGDQIDTDIVGAKRVGLRTALVLTGVSSKRVIERSPVKPDLVVAHVDDLVKYL